MEEGLSWKEAVTRLLKPHGLEGEEWGSLGHILEVELLGIADTLRWIS